MALGMKQGVLPDPPTTAYVMLGSECINNCAFCTQAREALGNGNMLSRVAWPSFGRDEVLKAMAKARPSGISRICLQCLMDPREVSDLPDVIRMIREVSGLPISVSISAVDDGMIRRIREAGAERIGIALDASSQPLFDLVKGSAVGNPYTWEGNWRSLRTAVDIFGRGNVSTHIIVGLGETDSEILEVLTRSLQEGILVSLFSYTPMKGTKEIGPAPGLERYRALQIARAYVMERGISGGFEFDDNGRLRGFPSDPRDLGEDLPDAFRTRGCPDCNRPYYNERPRGPMYNYPRELDEQEAKTALADAIRYLNGML